MRNALRLTFGFLVFVGVVPEIAAQQCSFSLNPAASPTQPAVATSGLQVAVTATPSTCSWVASASSSGSWLTLDAGSLSGTGNGIVTYSVAANPTNSSRSGFLTIGGVPFRVDQAASGASARALSQRALAVATTPLSISIAPNFGTVATGTVQQPLIAAGGASGSYAWSVTAGSLPPGIALRTDLPTGFPSNASAGLIGVATTPGTYNFTLTVTDGSQTVSQDSTITITALNVKDVTLPEAFVATPYSYALSALNAASPVFTLISNPPPGMALSSAGVLSGTPGSPGTFSIVFNLSDGTSTVTRSLSLSVYAVNITTAGQLPNGTQATSYRTTLSASGGTAPYAFSIAGGSLPSGLILSGSTISGTISASAATGNYFVLIAVRDSLLNTYTKTMALDVIGTTPAQIRIAAGNVDDAVVGNSYATGFSVCCGGTAPFTWTAAGLPPGMSIRYGSGVTSPFLIPGSGEIWGVPQVAGNYNVQLTVTDARGVTSSLTVPFRVSVLDHISLPAGTINTPYTSGLRVIGGTAPYSVTAAAGSMPLPSGLSLGSSSQNCATFPAGLVPFTSVSYISAANSAGDQLLVGSVASTSLGLPLPTSTDQKFCGLASLAPGFPEAAYVPTSAELSGDFSAFTGLLLDPLNGSAFPGGIIPQNRLGSVFAWRISSAAGKVAGTPLENGYFSPLLQYTDAAGNALKRTDSFPISGGAGATISITDYYDLGQIKAGSAYSRQLIASGVASYTWSLANSSLPTGVSISAGGLLSGTPTIPGKYSFLIKAADSAGAANPGFRQFILNVTPLTIAGSLPYGNVGAAYSSTLTASGGTGTLTWTLNSFNYLPPGLTLAANGALTGVPTSTGQYGFNVTVTDGNNNSSTAFYNVNIYAAGAFPPVAISTGSNLGTINLGTSQIPLTASGGSGTYSWSLSAGALPPGLAIRTDVPTYFGAASQAGLIGVATTTGTYSFTLTCTSGGQTATQTFTLRITSLTTLDAVLPDAFAGTAFTYQFTAVGSAAPMTFAAVASAPLPSGLTISSSGLLSGTVSAAGTYYFAIDVTHGTSTARQQYRLNVCTIQITTPGLLPNGTQGSPFSQSLAASGGTGNFTWRLSGALPAGLTLSPTGIISGTITAGPGLYSFQVTATDSNSASYTRWMSLDVIGAPATLQRIILAEIDDAVIGNHFSWQVPPCCGGQAPFTWSATGLPSGMAIRTGSDATGSFLAPGVAEIYGVPLAAGNFTVQLTVTDAAGTATTTTFPFHVSVLDVNAPSNTSSMPTGTINTPYTFAFRVLGGTAPYTVSQTLAGKLPGGLTVNGANATVSGTPNENGYFSPVFRFTDASGNTSLRNTFVTIASPSTIAISGAGFYGFDLGTATAGVNYSNQFFATGASSFLWSQSSGTLPPGLALSSSGMLSGTPTANGTYTFLLKATDSANSANAGFKEFTLAVSALSITTASPLTYGNVGTPYSSTLTATGNAGTLTWASAYFSLLPPGLTLSSGGKLSGTPTSPGQYSFTLQATDAANNSTAVRPYTLNIYPAGSTPPVAPCTTALTSSANPSAFGQGITLSSSVSCVAPTGSVTFMDGTSILATVPLSSGSAQFGIATLAAGTHSLSAVYSGDASHSSGTSSILTQTVSQMTTSTTLTSSLNPSVSGQTVTLSAMVLPTTATGSVSFNDGTATLGTGMLANGVATFSTSSLPVGSHSLNAVYGGDNNDAASTSPALVQTINQAPTSTLLTSSPNPSMIGQAVTLRATVTPSGATGTVTFSDGAATLGTASLSGGVATFVTSTLTVGSHTLTAAYSGDVSNPASTSPALTQSVRHLLFSDNFDTTASSLWANEAGAWSAVGGVYNPANGSLNPSAHSLVPFSLQDFSVHVDTTSNGDGGVWLRAFDNPGNSIGVDGVLLVLQPALGDAFFQIVQNGVYGPPVGQTTLGTGPHSFDIVVSGSDYAVFADGSKTPLTTLSSTAFAGGQAGLYATVPLGFDNFALYDFKTPTTTTVSPSLNPSVFGQNVVFTATVAPSTATGAVTFQDGSTTLGTVMLSSGVATFSTAGLTGGPHSLTASYAGDAINAPSVSAVLSQMVNQAATSTSLNSSSNPGQAGQTLALRAFVTPGSATGTVTFKDGSTMLGTAALSAGVATLSTPLGFGTHPLTATYGGDQNNAPSASPVLNQNQNYPPLIVSTGGVPAGQAGQPYGPVSFSATGGSGQYSWSASGLPQGLSVSSSGSLSGTPSGAFSGSITVTVADTVSNLNSSATYTLSITSTPLTLTGPPTLGNYLAGAAVFGSFSATGGSTPYTWSISGAPGISIDSNGNVSGSIGAGRFSAVVTVTDAQNNSANRTVSVSGFALTTGGLPPATTTTDYGASLAATGGMPPYTFTASGLPPGITFSGGSFSGRAVNPGSASIAVQARDAGGLTVATSYTLTITGSTALNLFSTSLSDATVGQPYADALSATGGSTPYTWSQSGGLLPAGLSLSSSGAVTGQTITPGSYSIGVQVTDAAGNRVVGTVSLNVKPAPLTITNGSMFPAGIVGIDYPPQILTATGGVPPYSFGVRGNLPAGLTLSNGQISGTPTVAADSGFTLMATDSSQPPVTALLGVSASIRPPSPDLVLASGSVAFSITSGTSTTPSPGSIGISSSVVSENIAFSTSASVPWLTVSGGSTTPGIVSIGLNSAALALSATGSPYSGTVMVACTSAVCAGKQQSITVTLTVTSPPPLLTLGTTLLSFASLASSPQASTASLALINSGGGTLKINSVKTDAAWLTVGTFPASVMPGPGDGVNVTVDPTGLAAGYYRGTVSVMSSGGSAAAAVTLFVSAAATMTLGPAGTQFSMPQGGILGNAGGSFTVSASNGATVPYTAAVLSGGSWLSVSLGSGTATGSSSGTVAFMIDPGAAAALATGAYYGTIRVSGSGVVNSPQDFQVILNVTPATTPVIPDPQPAGLVFVSAGGGSLASQTVNVYASSRTPLPYQAWASTDDGGNWLSISPKQGSTSASAPGTVTVSADPTGLKAGAYRGLVGFGFGSAVRAVNVTLIVQSAQSAPAARPALLSAAPGGVARANPAAAGPACANAQLVPTQTGLVSNFSAPTSWPTPLAVRLFDSCGSVVNDAHIVATFTNGDPPLPLTAVSSGSGVYSGTWTPRKTSSSLTINASVTVPGYPSTSVKIAGQVSPNTAPVLAPNAAGDVFHPQVGAGLGPGNIVQIYGSGLAGHKSTPTTLPLPTSMAGTSVLIGGIAAPLFYVSPEQINAQIPFELTAGNQYQLIVNANGALTTPQPIQLNGGTPSILNFSSGAVVAQHLDGTLVLDTSPAAPGEYIIIYSSGLGATDIPVASGTASPSDPPARVADPPGLTLDGNPVSVLFAGLTPGFVGLYQVNFQVPADMKTGNYELVMTQSGTPSNKTILAVRQ